MKKVLGIDLGGTSAKVGIVNQFGEVENTFIVKNSEKDILINLANSVIKEINNLGYDFNVDIERIGFACPGWINHEEGVVILAGNLGFKNYPIKQELIKLFNKKNVHVLNDVNAAALGEYWTGSASKFSSAIFYWLGTGIGGAIVNENKLFSGSHGFAGEFGHGGKMQNIEKCNCGLEYCMERTCSAVSFGKSFVRLAKKYNEEQLLKYFKNIDDITMEDVSNIYKENGKPKIIKDLIVEILQPLFTHMAIMIQALDPEVIIIGGGASAMGNDLLEIIVEEVKPLIFEMVRNEIKFEIASLGNTSGIVGAAYYSINNWED